MDWRETANRCVEIEQEVQEAYIDATGDVCDPGPLSALSACLSTLADGDEELAAAMFINLAEWLKSEELPVPRSDEEIASGQ